MKPGTGAVVGPQANTGKDRGTRTIQGEGGNRPLLMFALFLLVLILSLAAATQYFAHAFQYHPALGANLGHLYAPWKILAWLGQWPSHYSTQFSMAGSVGIMTAAFGLILLMALKKHLAQFNSMNSYLHGSARWAQKQDIARAGLLPRGRSILERLTGLTGQGGTPQPAPPGYMWAPGWIKEGGSITCATMARNMCCATHRRALARAWR